MKKLLLILTICVAALTTNAQNSAHRWSIGGGLGFTDFVNPINGQYLMFERWKNAANLNVQRYLGKSFDARLNFTMGNAFYPFANNQPANAQTVPAFSQMSPTAKLTQKGQMAYLNSQLWDFGLNLVYKFANGYVMKESAKVNPYLYSGIGGFAANSIGKNPLGGNQGGAGSDKFNAYIPLGAGFQFRLSDKVDLNAETAYKFALGDAYNFTQTNFRLGYSLGKNSATEDEKMATDESGRPNDNWCAYKWKVGVGPTFNSFEAVQRAQNFILEDYTTSLGLNFTRYLSRWFDIRANLGFGNVYYPIQKGAKEPYDGDNWNGTKGGDQYGPAQMFDINVQPVFKFANGTWLKEQAIFAPYIYAGPGLNFISSIGTWNAAPTASNSKQKTYGTDDVNSQIGTGLGFNFRTSDKFSVQLEAARNWRLDNSYSYNQANLRGVFAFGKVADCGNKLAGEEPKVETVIDSDGDGIPDITDECPYVAGKAEFFGCPDSDGDGIGDSRDKCPFEAGPASNGGCPEVAVVVDSDGDGVPDATDACPDVAGPASNNGCPVKTVDVVTPTKSVIGNYEVFFNNCTTLSAGQISTLQNIASILRNNPNYYVEIGGNTAAGGTQACSQQMAEKIASILRMKGVNVSTAVTQGYGDTRPKYNNSKDNRADISIYSFE